MSINIRPLQQGDHDNYIAMSREFFSSDAVDHTVPDSHFERTFALILERSPFVAGYIFELDSQTVGYAQLSFKYENEAGGMVLWIEECYLRPAARGHGVGGAFLRLIDDEYAGKIARVRLEVTAHNKGAIRLYEKHGYKMLDYQQMCKDS